MIKPGKISAENQEACKQLKELGQKYKKKKQSIIFVCTLKNYKKGADLNTFGHSHRAMRLWILRLFETKFVVEKKAYRYNNQKIDKKNIGDHFLTYGEKKILDKETVKVGLLGVNKILKDVYKHNKTHWLVFIYDRCTDSVFCFNYQKEPHVDLGLDDYSSNEMKIYHYLYEVYIKEECLVPVLEKEKKGKK